MFVLCVSSLNVLLCLQCPSVENAVSDAADECRITDNVQDWRAGHDAYVYVRAFDRAKDEVLMRRCVGTEDAASAETGGDAKTKGPRSG